MSEPEISLTENAAKRVAAIATRKHAPAILRLAVDGGGCAGFTYSFELAPAAEADDAIAETDGVKLVVDPASLELVRNYAIMALLPMVPLLLLKYPVAELTKMFVSRLTGL